MKYEKIRMTLDKRLSAILGTGKCIVDVGCGSGQLLAGLGGAFEHRIGLDVSRRRLEELAGGRIEGWEFREADLNEDFPLEDGCADAVVANQVIEHIINPVKFAGEIHRILRPDGRCVITTPNIRYAKNIAHILFCRLWAAHRWWEYSGWKLGRRTHSLFYASGYAGTVFAGWLSSDWQFRAHRPQRWGTPSRNYGSLCVSMADTRIPLWGYSSLG